VLDGERRELVDEGTTSASEPDEAVVADRLEALGYA
jgi:hypothetical protein